MNHVTTLPFNGSVESTIREGVQNGFLVDGDLTSKAAAKAAVDAKQLKAHVSIKQLAIPVKSALDVVDGVVAGATTGSSTANIYAGIDGNYGPGFSVSL